LTQESPDLLYKFGAFQGSTVGRFANRLEKGKFSLEGREYNVAVNFGPNSLHGGTVGFDKKYGNLRENTLVPQRSP